MNNIYKRSYVEVLEVLKHIPKEEFIKIPKEKVDFYKRNIDKKYMYSYDRENISNEAKAILINLYKNYIADEKEKVIIDNILKLNFMKKTLKNNIS